MVDDEPPIVELVRSYLERETFTVSIARDGPEALAHVEREQPDVVVLDVMLPGLDGVEVCRRLRAFSDAYVLMLTARSEEVDRIVGLAVGADDYLVKPFSPRELVARVRALLRRPRRPHAAPAARVVSVDEARHEVWVAGEPVELTAIEFAILATLARDPGVVVPRNALLDAVWGADYFGDDHVIDTHVANLRRRLGDDAGQPRYVETVRGVGFRLVDR